MSEPVKIALIFEGDDLMRVITAGLPVEYVTIDRDVEGIEEDRLVIFDGHEAYVRHYTAEFTLEGCALAMEAFSAVEAALCLPAYRESIGEKPFCFPGDLVDHAAKGRGKVVEAGDDGVQVAFDGGTETVPFADLSAVPGIYTAEGLIERYGKWGEHPVYTDHMWRRDTKTRLGYFEWLAEQMTRDLPSFAADQPGEGA